MKPFEFMRVYHPKLGIFVDKHVGSGIMIDNVLKPMRRILSPVLKKFVKQSGKKALKSGVSHLSERVNKNKYEKSGDMIMEKLRNIKPIKQQEESTDMMINRLISGSGVKRMSRVKIM